MDRTTVLHLWETVHRPLDEGERQAFLARSEVDVLAGLPEAGVSSAMTRSAKLDQITAVAQGEAWWHRGQPCDDDDLPWCSRCKPHPFPAVVVISRGSGAAFHRSARCQWLVKGQEQVARWGGDPAPVEQVHVQVALGEGKSPCLACFPFEKKV